MATHAIKANLDVDGEVQGTSLDINGAADISGDLTGCAYKGDVIASAYLDSDTAHLTTTQTFTGAKTFTNTVALTGTGRITGIDTVSAGTDAANKTYVDTMLPKAGGTMTGDLILGDNVKLEIGSASGGDLQIYHDGSHSFISDQGTGNLTLLASAFVVNNAADSENMIIASSDGSVNLYYNGAQKFRTVSAGVEITGNLDVNSGGITLDQGYGVNLGVSGYDLKMPSSTTVTLTTGTENAILATLNAGVKLYYNDSVKLETYDAGAGVTGNLYLTSGSKIHFDNGVSNSYSIEKSSTALTFSTGGTYTFNTGNATFAGTISGTTITATNSIVIPDSGTIGSASDTDAIAIEDDGSVLFSSHIEANGNIIFDGNTITGVNDSGEFDDDDAHIMTSAGINDRFAVINANTTGSSGSCTGLAATATALATARDIGGVSFNGTAAINLPGVNTAGNQNTSGTAAIATTVTVADESSDTSCNVLFATAATGNLGPKSGTNLTFNSSSGVLTATGFAGALTGNVTGNASGSSGSCTGNAATATLAATSTIASDTGSATHFPVFVDGSTGARALKAHSAWNYNPGTETLTAGKLATDVASIVEDNKSNSALMTLTGQGAGDEGNVSLKMLGTSAGNPIKLKMAGLDDGGSQVGAGFLSYDAEDDSFGIGQSSSHNRMGVKIENTISLSSPNVHYEPVSIKAREYVASANSTHYDFYGDIIRNGNDTTVRGKMYCYKNGTWTISNADTKLDANGMLGIAIGTNSTTHGMLLKGTYTLDYDPGSNGNPLYVSATDGLLSITVPSTSGHIVRLVGYLLGGTHGNIFFNPDSTYLEVA